MPTGEMFYGEQTSHRPSTSSWLLEDPDGDYVMYGSYTLKGWLNGPASFAGAKEGVLTLKLKDGTTYKFTKHPILSVTGLV
jgi:hypothetical protein